MGRDSQLRDQLRSNSRPTTAASWSVDAVRRTTVAPVAGRSTCLTLGGMSEASSSSCGGRPASRRDISETNRGLPSVRSAIDRTVRAVRHPPVVARTTSSMSDLGQARRLDAVARSAPAPTTPAGHAWVIVLEFRLAMDRDHDQRGRGELTHQVTQQQQRRLVRRMQVVQDE